MVYQAPSWSWPSIDGYVSFAEKRTYFSVSPLVEILEVVIDFVSDDKFGQVQGGHLNLLGQTIDLEVLERKSKVERSKVLFNGKLSSAWILEDLANIRTETSTNQLSYLPLHIDLYGNQFYITGLILECVDVTRNEYRRVGLLEYSKIIPFGSGHTGKVSIEDPFLSTIGDIEQTEYGTHVFKKRSADLREITII